MTNDEQLAVIINMFKTVDGKLTDIETRLKEIESSISQPATHTETEILESLNKIKEKLAIE